MSICPKTRWSFCLPLTPQNDARSDELQGTVRSVGYHLPFEPTEYRKAKERGKLDAGMLGLQTEQKEQPLSSTGHVHEPFCVLSCFVTVDQNRTKILARFGKQKKNMRFVCFHIEKI